MPRRICNTCVNKLEDISLFVDISKYNATKSNKYSMPKKELGPANNEGGSSFDCRASTKESSDDWKEGMSLKESICLVCSSPDNLMSVKGKEKQMQMYRNIINISVKGEMYSGDGNAICSRCVDILEDTSSFISWSLLIDGKLDYAIGSKEHAECENPSYLSKIDFSKCNDMMQLGHNVHGIGDKSVVVDIKKDVFDNTNLGTCTVANYKKDSELHSQTSSENTSTRNFVSKHDFPSFSDKKCEGNSFLKHTSRHRILKHLGKDDSSGRSINDSLESANLPQIQRIEKSSTWQMDSIIHAGDKPFKCNFCDKSFGGKFKLRLHEFTHTGERPFECNYCDKSFKHPTHLRHHLLIHDVERQFKCERCKKSFAQSSQLRTHLFTHTGEKPYKCDHCGKGYSRNRTLQKHLDIHTGNNPFKCNFCDKSFAHDSKLRAHLFTHTEQKPHKCNHCEKGFSQKAILQKHLNIHTGNNPFKCNFCDKSFAHDSNLRTHLFTHTGEKPHKCNHCEKRFSRKGILRKHLNIHTGNNPFKCNFCDKSFAHDSNLREHLFTHTGKNLTNVITAKDI